MKKLLTTVGAIAALALTGATAAAQAAPTAITLVHGIPGTTVDVVVDGDVVVDDFAPGETADLTSFAGETLANVEVIDASDDTTVVIGPIASLDVPDSGNWSIVAMLDEGGTPRLASFENNTSPVDAGNARLTVRHAAAAGAVDIVVGDQRPVTGLTNGSSQELTLPVGTVSGAQLAPAGGAPIADIGDIALGADTNTILYAVGSEADNTIAFITQIVVLQPPATTTTAADATTTTVVDGSTTTTIDGTTTTTSSTSTSSTAAVPQAVNTGSPIDDNGNTILLIAVLGGLVVAGGAFLARRRA